jgi:epoxyqueuosine reductase
MTNDPIAARLKTKAREFGFSLVGIAPAAEADGFARYRRWLDRGFAGEMSYLHHQAPPRRHPASVLAGARSVVMLGMEYAGPTATVGEGMGAHPLPDGRGSPGRVASYAAGPDYHRFVWDRLSVLIQWLITEAPGARARGVADTAPLLERDFARRAGLGWVGKNTMLIHPERGSFFFLAALVTDLELPADEPFGGSHCGTCTACLDACPTQAFPEPHVLDATRCISYLTIELRSQIPEQLREPMGDWLFGCDVCQDVCPWNRKPSPGPDAFPRDPAMEWLDPIELLGMDAEAFRAHFKPTALWRARRVRLLRNAAIVLGNTGDERALPALERAMREEEAVVREAAAWAIGRIRQRSSSVG